MVTVRRWYVFLVCAVNLQALTWASITLLNNLFPRQTPFPRQQVALVIAIILISLPIYLVHWLWAQSLARGNPEERGSLLRRLYLYAMLAAFLIPILVKAYDFIEALFSWQRPNGFASTPGHALVHSLESLFVLGLLWFYHRLQVKTDERLAPPEENTAVVRRFYVLSFSAVGLILVLLGVKGILLFLLYLGAKGDFSGIKQLIVGLPLWLAFWRQAQDWFASPSEEEKASMLRKFYLYAWVFVAALLFVANASLILAGVLRKLLGLSSLGDARDLLPLMIVMATTWAYHSSVIRQDTNQAAEMPRQAALRRLYLYLIAGIGLTALLAGVGGVLHVLIRVLSGENGRGITGQFAEFTATLLAGLPVWLVPWQKLQRLGQQAYRSVIRKIYLYLFIFAATMAMLASATFIAYFLLSKLIGVGNDLTFTSLAQALAFALIALGVWLYHGFVIREDSRRSQEEQAARLSLLPVLVIEDGSGLASRIVDSSCKEIAAISIEAFSPAADSSLETLSTRIAAAGLIVLPWQFARPESGLPPQLIDAITASPARKLLLPSWPEGYDWAGVERRDQEALVRQTVAALKQVFSSETVHPVKPLGLGTMLGMLLIVPFILWMIVAVIGMFGQYVF